MKKFLLAGGGICLLCAIICGGCCWPDSYRRSPASYQATPTYAPPTGSPTYEMAPSTETPGPSGSGSRSAPRIQGSGSR